jgi:hypothetical protein
MPPPIVIEGLAFSVANEPKPEWTVEAMPGATYEITCEVRALYSGANTWGSCGDTHVTGISLIDFLGGDAKYQVLGYVLSGLSAASVLFQVTSKAFLGKQSRCADFALDSMRGIFMNFWDILVYGLEDPIS